LLIALDPEIIKFQESIDKIDFFERASSAPVTMKVVKHGGKDYLYPDSQKSEIYPLIKHLLASTTTDNYVGIVDSQGRFARNLVDYSIAESSLLPGEIIEKVYEKDAALEHLASLGVRITLPGIDPI
jgi:hypothetical protein